MWKETATKYNSTYSQGHQSFSCALKDIETQIALGQIRNALVLEFDEEVEVWDKVLALIGTRTQAIARAYVYKKE